MRTRTALIILLLFLSAPAAQADLTPERTREAHALIAQFSDRRFAVRQQAVNKLVAMGPDVIPLLQKTLGETKDLEVKLRCRMTLKRVTEKYHVVIDDGKAKVLNFGASRITIDETDVPLAEVLGMLVEQSGNRPITPLKIGEERVSLKIKDMPYWQAVDTLCSSSGLAWGAYWGPHLFRVYKVKVPAHYVCVYTGPAAVRVARVTREFTDRRILEFGADRNPVGENHTTHRGIDIQLTFYVEDRLPLISGKMEVTKVLTPDGVNRLATHVG